MSWSAGLRVTRWFPSDGTMAIHKYLGNIFNMKKSAVQKSAEEILTKKKLREIRDLFQLVDADGQGSINREQGAALIVYLYISLNAMNNNKILENYIEFVCESYGYLHMGYKATQFLRAR